MSNIHELLKQQNSNPDPVPVD